MIAEETRFLVDDEDATVTVRMLRVNNKWRVTVDDLAELTEAEFEDLAQYILKQFAVGRRRREMEEWHEGR